MPRAGGRKRKHSAKEYVDAIYKARGVIAIAAQILGVSRPTVYDAVNKYATVKAALDDARESTIDLAEGKLIGKIATGDLTAIIFYLKTIGKKRGYVERQENTTEHKFDGVLGIDVHVPADSDDDTEA